VVREDRRARSHRVAETPEGEGVENAPPGAEWEPTLLERQRGEFEVARELARARREQRELSIVLFEVSRLARGQGDAARSPDDQLFDGVADTLVRGIRQSDLPIRWSGNELLLVLPGLPGAEARTVAERVRAAMQAGGRHRVAVAGGVAELETDEQFSTVVSRARAKVAQARVRGNNRVS
jgi:diguanylate cyclase (GGDEF)-like protein